MEWDVAGCVEDRTLSSSCICGKENLRYLFTIRNRLTGKTLFPIGSSCIEKFGRDDLNEIAAVREKLFKLLHAIDSGDFITLSPEHFSRKLLSYLYDHKAFRSTDYNKHNPRLDYQFLLDMFNKRDKSSITPAQNKKISAIILSSVKPFLQKMLGTTGSPPRVGHAAVQESPSVSITNERQAPISTYYYYDNTGQKRGAVTLEKLKSIVALRKITLGNAVETPEGKTVPARAVVGHIEALGTEEYLLALGEFHLEQLSEPQSLDCEN